MSRHEPQNYQNHKRFIPLFHIGCFGLLTLYIIFRIYKVITEFNATSVMALALGIAVIVVCLYSRTFALRAQDRVIRLEMRLRLARILPENLRARIDEFTIDQLIALRFAGDGELPELARRALDEKITDRETLKKMITDWQADYLRV